MNYISVAIDGPAGAGKSTISKAVASLLNYVYVDTGAIYRAIAYSSINNGLDTKKDIEPISELAGKCSIEIKYIDKGQRIILDGSDVSDYIRTPQISKGASDVSAIPGVRTALLNIQRDIANNNNVIMDGRDIGTIVLPDATVKIFLTASTEVRANRRYKEMLDKGIDCSFDEILKDIIYRDKQDSERDVAPLKPADDSIIFDNSDFDFEQSVNHLYKIIKENI